MKPFHKILAAVCVLFLAGFSGCTTDDPSPSPGDPRTAFVGKWLVVEQGKKGTFEVTISIVASSTTEVAIYNFANSGQSSNPAIADVSATTITLKPDMIIGDGWVVNGGGALTTSTTMNWNYTLLDGADLKQLTAVFTKN